MVNSKSGRASRVRETVGLGGTVGGKPQYSRRGVNLDKLTMTRKEKYSTTTAHSKSQVSATVPHCKLKTKNYTQYHTCKCDAAVT